MRERDIIYETGSYWVGQTKQGYVVFRNGLTHSVSDSVYAKSMDGLSIAKARCDYLAKREKKQS